MSDAIEPQISLEIASNLLQICHHFVSCKHCFHFSKLAFTSNFQKGNFHIDLSALKSPSILLKRQPKISPYLIWNSTSNNIVNVYMQLLQVVTISCSSQTAYQNCDKIFSVSQSRCKFCKIQANFYL